MTNAKPKPKPLTITITPDAAEHVRSFAAEAGKPGTQLRVAVIPTA